MLRISNSWSVRNIYLYSSKNELRCQLKLAYNIKHNIKPICKAQLSQANRMRLNVHWELSKTANEGRPSWTCCSGFFAITQPLVKNSGTLANECLSLFYYIVIMTLTKGTRHEWCLVLSWYRKCSLCGSVMCVSNVRTHIIVRLYNYHSHLTELSDSLQGFQRCSSIAEPLDVEWQLGEDTRRWLAGVARRHIDRWP